MSMTVPGIGAALGQLDIDAVIRGNDYYIKLPASIATLIPGGKPWMHVNIDQVGRAAGIPGLGSVVSSEQSFSDPSQYLTFLKAVSRNGIKSLGSEMINGVQTTHYQGELDLSRIASVVPAADRAATQKLVATLQQNEHLGALPFDAWIDGQNRIRRIALKYSVTIPGSSSSGSTTTGSTSTTGSIPQMATVNLTEDFTAYGAQPVPATPPSDQTVDILSLLHHTK
jgi:hypothetical protein